MKYFFIFGLILFVSVSSASLTGKLILSSIILLISWGVAKDKRGVEYRKNYRESGMSDLNENEDPKDKE